MPKEIPQPEPTVPALLTGRLETVSPQDLERHVVIANLTRVVRTQALDWNSDIGNLAVLPYFDERGKIDVTYYIDSRPSGRSRKAPLVPHYLKDGVYYHNDPRAGRQNGWHMREEPFQEAMFGTGYIVVPPIQTRYAIHSGLMGTVAGRFNRNRSIIKLRLESARAQMQALTERVTLTATDQARELEALLHAMEHVDRFINPNDPDAADTVLS